MLTLSAPSSSRFRVRAHGAVFGLAAILFHSGADAQPTVASFQVLRPTKAASDAAAIDLDGDGAPEVIVSDKRAKDVSIFWSDGLGFFTERTTIPIGEPSRWVVTGDFDSDGDGDAVVAVASGVVTLVNDGNRAFSVRGPFSAGPPDYQSPLVLDVNGDGDLDLVGSSSREPVVTILFGTGAGDFARSESRTISAVASQIEMRDFDGDGKADLLALERTTPGRPRQFEILSGVNGDPIEAVPLGAGSGFLALGDFDEDGLVDVAVNESEFFEIVLFRGEAGGRFSEAGRIPAQRKASGIVAADFDADSHLDLAVTPGMNAPVDVFGPTLYWGDGRLGFSAGPTLSSGEAANRVRAEDVSGDGKPDLLVQHSFLTEEIAVLLNDGRGGFSQPGAGPSVPAVLDCVTGDLDGDGHADVAIAAASSAEVAFVSGDGRGRFGEAVISDSVEPLWNLAAGDVDGDSIPDLVCTTPGDSGIRIGRGNGAGGFDFEGEATPVDRQSRVGDVALADVDADGDLDVVASQMAGTPPMAGALLLNDGTGSLEPPILFGAGSPLARVTIADFDGDDRLDLVVADTSENRVRLFRRLDSTEVTFGEVPFVDLRARTHPEEAAVADVDGDGAADIVLASFTHGIVVCRGAGDGTFRPPSSFGEHCYRALVGDFNGDGSIDVASVYESLTLFPGTGTGRFDRSQSYGSLSSGGALASADFDEDGFTDFVLGHASDFPERRLSLLFGRDWAFETCRRGNVNAGRGPIADVLFVNVSTGGSERRVETVVGDPLLVFVKKTPAATGPEPFALYAWLGEPRRSDARRLPGGIGVTCLPTPLSGGEPRPRAIWNNVPGSEALLGVPRFPSSPAPSVVFARQRGLRAPIVFFLQGIISDPGAPNGRAAVTNGVVVDVK